MIDLSNIPEDVDFTIVKRNAYVNPLNRYIVEIGGIPHSGNDLQQAINECAAEYKILCAQQGDHDKLVYAQDVSS